MTGLLQVGRVCWMLVALLAVGTTGVLAQEAGVDEDQLQVRADTLPPVAAETQIQTALALTERAPSEPDVAEAEADDGPKVISGMSILGNQEAPTSLVIVPWKSSQIGESVNVSTVLDDSRQPVDKDVFMRALRYYEIRSETSP